MQFAFAKVCRVRKGEGQQKRLGHSPQAFVAGVASRLSGYLLSLCRHSLSTFVCWDCYLQSPGAKLIIRTSLSFVKAIWLFFARLDFDFLEQFRSLRDRDFPARSYYCTKLHKGCQGKLPEFLANSPWSFREVDLRRTRTPDLRRAKAALSQLSYRPVPTNYIKSGL